MKADKIFVLDTETGKAIKDYLVYTGIPKDKIDLVLNGVDTELSESIETPEKVFDACFLGGLRPSKGLYDIVPVWQKVCLRKKDAKLLMIGAIAPNYLNILKNEISKNKMDQNIVIVGYVSENKTKLSILKSSKVFFFPSHSEGFGIAILDAMSCGLPVIAWDLPVYKKIFSKGLIAVPLGQTEEMAQNILRLLNNDELLEVMSKDALKLASKYSWNEIALQELTLIESL